MKHFFVLIAFIFVALACQNSNSTENTTVEQTNSLTAYHPYLQTIIKTDSGIFRGINLGESWVSIQAKEQPLEVSDSTESQLISLDLVPSGSEFADIQYFLSSKKILEHIKIDVFLDKQSRVDSLRNSFKLYFDKRYGKPTSTNAKIDIWQKNGLKILLDDNGVAQAPGLAIEFTPTVPL